MNKEQIINEVYENYTQTKIIKTDGGETHISPIGHYNGMTKEQFINKCKTDPEFSERWGLKIEERELSLEERIEILRKVEDSIWLNTGLVVGVIEPMLEEHNIPTKQITITYKDTIIESYE